MQISAHYIQIGSGQLFQFIYYNTCKEGKRELSHLNWGADMKLPKDLAYFNQAKFYDKSRKSPYWGRAIKLDYFYLKIPLIISSSICL